jgi:hypothetical protein
MVHSEVWTLAGMKKGFLCIGCLEKRIGRELVPADFTDVPINDPDNPWNTPRLRSRLLARVTQRGVFMTHSSPVVRFPAPPVDATEIDRCR